MTMRLEHVNMTVADLDRSIKFYCDLFGWHVRWQSEPGDPGRRCAHVGSDQFYLAINQAVSTDGSFVQDGDTIGMNHYGFVVDDLEPIKTWLDAQGIESRFFDDHKPAHRIYFDDPDGFEVEIVKYLNAEAAVSNS